MTRWLLASVVLLHLSATTIAAEDPIFDVQALVATPLNPRTLKSTERDGVITEEVRFHSEQDGDKDVDIFAFFSYPKGAKRLPAYIWNQGGLAQANPAVTEVGLEHLNGLASLQVLSLGNTQITDAGLEHLKGLSSLQRLSLDNTQVTDSGVAALKAALGGVRVRR